MPEKNEGIASEQEKEKSKQEYLNDIARFKASLEEMKRRFFSEAGTIKNIKEQLFFLEDYIHNEPE